MDAPDTEMSSTRLASPALRTVSTRAHGKWIATLRNRGLDLLAAVGTWATNNARVRRLVYEARNRDVFVDLYQHDRMLADRPRVDAYQAALAKYLQRDDVVVDLGAGTGVLSLLAAPNAAEIHAVEHGPVVEAARAVAAENGVGNIHFHRMHSRSFDLPGKADVIVHEQIGDALFDERVLDNVTDLRDRVLKTGGRILPGLLQLFIEPVQLRDGYRAPYAWDQVLHGLTFRSLEVLASKQKRNYQYRVFRPFPFGHLLTSPRPLLSVDLHTANVEDLPKSLILEREIVQEGHLDGFVVYFAAHFDEELSFTSSPLGAPSSWGTPLLRCDGRLLRRGDAVRLDLRAEDLAAPATWKWRVVT
jgi:type I protein arginine methyltransferase